MKGNKIMALIWLVIAVFLTVILVTKLRDNRNRNNNLLISVNGKNFGEAKLYKTETFKTSDINEIDVNLASESLYVEKTNDNNIIVELYCAGSEQAPEISVYKNVLKIEEKNKVNIVGFGNRKIVIKLPANYEATNIDLDTASGSIHVNDIVCPTLDCHASSGSIHFENCKIDSLDVKASSGSVHLNNCEADNLECSTQSGSIKMNGSFDKVQAHGISGSISAQLETPLLFDSDFQTTSGSIKLDVPGNSNMKIKYSVTSGTYKNDHTGSSGKKGSDTMGSNGPTVELRSTSGSIKIQ